MFLTDRAALSLKGGLFSLHDLHNLYSHVICVIPFHVLLSSASHPRNLLLGQKYLTKIYFKSIEGAINALQSQKVYALMAYFCIERSRSVMALIVSFAPTIVFAIVALVPAIMLTVAIVAVVLTVMPAAAWETCWVRVS